MPGEPIPIGPFVGGLNTFSDPTSIADTELVECRNFELDLDGSLVSRPPIVDLAVAFPLGTTGNVELLGYYYAAGGVPYLIASDGLNSTYYYVGTSWVLLTSTISASAIAQFNDQIWLLAPVGSTNPGGYWTPSGGFVADADMPKGTVIVSHKSRLWVATGKNATVNGTRLYFSKLLGSLPLTDFWLASPDFIDIGAGDGQNIIQVVVYYNSLLVFRSNSIYTYQYSSDPASGSVSLIVPGVGLTEKDCLVAYEGYLYFMHEDKAYEFFNNRVAQLNVKVPFRAGSKVGLYRSFAVSIFGKRVIFSFYDTMFVFSLNTRTWTSWVSTLRGAIGRIVSMEDGSETATAIAHSSVSVASGTGRTAKTFRISEVLSDSGESMICSARTKNFSYEASSVFKRLFWWGMDSTFRTQVTAVATPITTNYTVLWSDLLAYNWTNMLSFAWDQPLTGTISVETNRDTTGFGAARKFVKFRKGLRFRQINFKLDFTTDGTNATAPVRLFSLMTYVKPKERVSKTIS